MPRRPLPGRVLCARTARGPTASIAAAPAQVMAVFIGGQATSARLGLELIRLSWYKCLAVAR